VLCVTGADLEGVLSVGFGATLGANWHCRYLSRLRSAGGFLCLTPAITPPAVADYVGKQPIGRPGLISARNPDKVMKSL
jgi:hypothetical protein